MTLKEKIEQYIGIKQIDVIHLEQIADDYALEFAKWCLKIRFEPIENISVEKLLKIYKKEQFKNK